MKKTIFLASYLAIVAGLLLWGSGIVPAIVPAAVPTANKIGNSTKFQLGTGTPTAGNCASYDASGNVQDFGAPCNGTAGSVAFNNITSGTNTVMTGTLGAGGSIVSTSTGIVEANKIRNYTVATLPAATAGNTAYVTDGTSATDCTTGSGSTKVLCQANGSVWAVVGAATNPAGSAGQLQYNNSGAFGALWSPIVPNQSFTTNANITSLPQTGWTIVNGALLMDFAAGITHIAVPTAASLNARLVTRSLTIPYTAICVLDTTGDYAGSSVTMDYGMFLSDGTKLASITKSWDSNAMKGRVSHWNSVTSFNTAIATLGYVLSNVQAYKITNDSTNRTYYYWSNGAWVQAAQEASGTFLTETAVGFGGFNGSNANDWDGITLLFWDVH